MNNTDDFEFPKKIYYPGSGLYADLENVTEGVARYTESRGKKHSEIMSESGFKHLIEAGKIRVV